MSAATSAAQAVSSQDPSPEYQVLREPSRLNSLTSSTVTPPHRKSRDPHPARLGDQGFYAEGGAYWAAAQQFTYYLIDSGCVRAYDTEGDDSPPSVCSPGPPRSPAADP